MKFSVKSAFLTAVILFLAFTQGCVNVSYKGASYPPTEKVEIVKKQKGIPAGYTVMGKAVATAPSEEGSRQEMENRIIKKAKSEGADAVMIVLFELVKIGEERDDQFMDTSYDNAGWGMDVDTQGDTNQMDYSHTGTTPSERMDTPVYKSLMKAVFLKKN
jgi:uncharacterized protein YbjQ (UPF0145 family)